MTVRTRTKIEQDMLALLSGSEAGQMLRVALSERGQVRSWSVHAVHHRPGAGVSVGYTVILDELGTDGVNRLDRYFVASTGKIDEARLAEIGGKTLVYDDVRVHIWEHPDDPDLPALRLACDPGELTEFFGEYADVELLAYRPTRRAVVRVDLEETSYFAKVCRPSMLDPLVTRFDMLERAGFPSPAVERVDERGFVVTRALEGVALNKIYAQFRPGHEKAMRATLNSLQESLEALPLLSLGLKRRPAWVDRAGHYASAAVAALPTHEEAIRDVEQGIAELIAVAEFGPLVPTHGDFYEANIFIDPETGAVSGVLDVDNLGPGYRANDWGCLLGHLSVLPGLSQRSYGQTASLLEDWKRKISSLVDPVALAASAAGVALSLVAGARKSKKKDWMLEAEFRLNAAREWIEWGRGFLGDLEPVAEIQ